MRFRLVKQHIVEELRILEHGVTWNLLCFMLEETLAKRNVVLVRARLTLSHMIATAFHPIHELRAIVIGAYIFRVISRTSSRPLARPFVWNTRTLHEVVVLPSTNAVDIVPVVIITACRRLWYPVEDPTSFGVQ